jgi:hypothetical protein
VRQKNGSLLLVEPLDPIGETLDGRTVLLDGGLNRPHRRGVVLDRVVHQVGDLPVLGVAWFFISPWTTFCLIGSKTSTAGTIARETLPATADDRMFAAHTTGEMDVRLTENYGQFCVTDAGGGKPLSEVYARLADGRLKYHGDGYTDVRGRFDYASVNTPERQPVERFAVLVLGDDRGAVIREAAPPQQ